MADVFLFNLIHSLAFKSAFLDGLAVFLAKFFVYFLILGTVFFIFSFKNVRKRIFVFAVIAMTIIVSRGILTEVIRFIYNRKRPFEVLEFEPLFPNFDPSFPSGHAAFLFALAIAVFYFSRFWGWWFLGFSFLVGISRIFVGIHWPSDILGGIAVALIAFLIIKRLLKSYTPKNSPTT